MPLDKSGSEIVSEKRLTRGISSTSPAWDEVFPLCARTNSASIDQIGALRIKIKHFDNKLKSVKLGEVDIPLSACSEAADVNAGRYSVAWYSALPPGGGTIPRSSSGSSIGSSLAKVF
ncbi:hypothetical protein EON62_01825, partial [archaeon]